LVGIFRKLSRRGAETAPCNGVDELKQNRLAQVKSTVSKNGATALAGAVGGAEAQSCCPNVSRFNKKYLLLSIYFLLILLVAVSLPAWGGKEKETTKPLPEPVPVQVTVTGKVRLTGSSPMTSLVITGERREWIVEPAEEKKLKLLQQQTVTVSGKEYYVDCFFANGKPAGRKYFLKEIVIAGEEKN